MNTNNLKRFAKEARIKLLDQVGRKLDFVLTQDTAELRGKQKEIEQLKRKIAEQGKEQVIEMVAYTWFNRLMALRFMDANGYTMPKVVTPLQGMTNPEILQNALGGNIEPELKLDRQRLNDLLDGKTAATDAHTEAYKMLLVASCNQWHTVMPFMFERISDYTELLLPDDLLSDYSIVADIRNGMSEEDCQQEELIGWLYQFYIADKKDEVFDGLKKNIKITAENIPAATQLFTPRWIVRYMVENTLGKLWLALKPKSKLRQFMPYYIEAPDGNAPAPLPEGIKGVTDITFLDPCQGSGHVLVYAFDLFTKIYEEEGYNTNEIPALILQHNLFGIDIDERAAQLAAFALTMKARSYYSRFLRKPIAPTVFALKNCGFTTDEINQLCAKGLKPVFEKLYLQNLDKDSSGLLKYLKLLAKKEKTELLETAYEELLKVLEHFDNEANLHSWIESHPKKTKAQKIKETLETGSLDQWVWNYAFSEFEDLRYKISLYNQFENIGSLFMSNHSVVELLAKQKSLLNSDNVFESQLITKIELGIKQSKFLSKEFYCVVTNPPYMGDSKLNPELSEFVNSLFPDSRLDLMTCFLERGISLINNFGYLGMINQHSWMFISSYKNLRKKLLETIFFESMIHLGPRAFPEIGGEVVQNTAFTIKKNVRVKSLSNFYRLVDFDSSEKKRIGFIDSLNNSNSPRHFVLEQSKFDLIPNYNICYWFSDKLISNFSNQKIEELSISKAGIVSGNDSDFLKLWFEVSYNQISFNEETFYDEFLPTWVPINKGGGFRKYFGNEEYVINIKNLWLNGRTNKSVRRGDPEFYFKEAITWTMVCGTTFSFRYSVNNTFATAAPAIFFENKNQTLYVLGFLNSKISMTILPGINPTINLGSGDVSRLPIVMPNTENGIINLVLECIDISKTDWISRENSWNFTENQVIKQGGKYLNLALESFKKNWEKIFFQLHQNEQILNDHYLEIYGLKNELSNKVDLGDITILQEEAKVRNGQFHIDDTSVLVQLISYSIGCIFGRYSIDKPGLILANQGESFQDFFTRITLPTFLPDKDNIVPVLEGEWFTDDIVGRFKVFLKAAFGEEHFKENIKYIEDTIGKDIRKYFVKDFYNDHIKRYKKRPIYWMFSSPKGHFKALIYMHRYQPDLCSKMLNDYLQAFISKLEAAKQTQTMLSLREDISAREKAIAIKEIDKYEAMLKDCREYEKTLFTIATQKISIDLDDGVKVNYQKFKEVLVQIKGLEKEED